ncbi:MAG TPA: 5'/3'-nucleotidase SurE [Saprospiraceae bacterium]|nr:5'/3'-nucleotidase SurE [Saprospiraceae bacterium]HNT22011.1 5'/3'-nucleotidase SurE [Saprospiraceae bacterium]
MPRPLILVTNDDGLFAPGIRALVKVAAEFGEIVIVAPNSPQSGQGHAVTLESPLRINRVNTFGDIEAYECTGTPVDCVKLAKHLVLRGRKVNLCLSGINHGSNSSINIIYSGTMSAAMEASIEGIDSIGFSLLDFSFDADFESSEFYVRHIIEKTLRHGLTHTNLLNVNIPKLKKSEIRGIRVCRQAEGRWQEEFMEGTDPRGQKYYWLTGKFVTRDALEDTDEWALHNGYISVVPSGHNLTRYQAIEPLRFLENV